MTTGDDASDEVETEGVPEETVALTNFELLAQALPETGIARALLAAWREGDPIDRVTRLVKVAQPVKSEEKPNGTSDH